LIKKDVRNQKEFLYSIVISLKPYNSLKVYLLGQKLQRIVIAELEKNIPQSISVAMCTYNGAKYLHEQLDSITNQTRLPDELIVCDDCSSDNTIQIVKEFASKAPFLVRYYVNSKNLGPTKNFEKAITLCNGDIIALADQDDVWKTQKLSKYEMALIKHPTAGYVFSNAEILDENLISLNSCLWDMLRFTHEGFNSNIINQINTLLERNVVTGMSMAFRALIKKLVLPVSPLWSHDGWIALLASSAGLQGIALPEKLAYYRRHTDQVIGIQKYSKFRAAITSLRTNERENDDIEDYRKRSMRLQAIRDQLIEKQCAQESCTSHAMKIIKKKSDHLLMRGEIRLMKSTSLKLAMIMTEIKNGGYRHSGSWTSVIKDLLF